MMKTSIIVAFCLLATPVLAQAPPTPQFQEGSSPQETILPDQLASALCTPLEKAQKDIAAHGGAPYKDLNNNQMQFLRGISFISPESGPGVPPGDKAVISALPDGAAEVIFVDGDTACFPMMLPKMAVDAVKGIGRGDTTHLHPSL